MIRKNFIDREKELKILEESWKREEFSLIIIYGRRRVGKTRLIKEFIKGKKSIYYSAIEANYNLLCNEFSEIVKKNLGLPLSGDIIDVMSALTDIIDEKIIIVFDEFQYIVEADKSFTSKLQRLIDSKLLEKNILIILCGSSVSFFEKELLGYKSPIFGRRTSTIVLKPLKFKDIAKFFPKYDIFNLVTIYGVVGGTPAYLEKLDPYKSVEENIKYIITPGNYLYDEATNLLRQEVREPRTYFNILSLIAQGYTRPSQIANMSSIDPRSINKYIDLLVELDILKRIKPMGQRAKVRLDFTDNYFRFWFTYNYKLRSILELHQIDEAMTYIKTTLNNYLSKVFEGIIEEIVPELYKRNIIKTNPIEIGKWWHKGEEIDLIVREPGKSTTFIEAKWRKIKPREGEKILKKLEEKSTKTGLQSRENYYLLIAKEIDGETTQFTKDNYQIIDLNTIEKLTLL